MSGVRRNFAKSKPMKCLFCGSDNIKPVQPVSETKRCKCADCGKQFFNEDAHKYATVDLTFEKYACAFKCDLSKLRQKDRKEIYDALTDQGYRLPGGGAIRDVDLAPFPALAPKVPYICVGHNRSKKDEKEKWLFSTARKFVYDTYQAWRVTPDELRMMLNCDTPS